MPRSILITGCSSGIGLDAARGLHTRGWRVFATCRQEADCERLRGEGLESFRLDYADEDSIAAAVEEVRLRTGGTLDAVEEVRLRTGGTLDALFNNGAYACPGAVEDLPRAALRAIFEVNLFGYHDLARRVIPLMRAQGHGRIVNCSSVLGFVGMTWRGAYVATKFAMEGLTDVLRIEMRGTGIDIILIEPGPIATKIRENAIPHFEKWIDWKTSARADQYRTLLGRLYESWSLLRRQILASHSRRSRLSDRERRPPCCQTRSSSSSPSPVWSCSPSCCSGSPVSPRGVSSTSATPTRSCAGGLGCSLSPWSPSSSLPGCGRGETDGRPVEDLHQDR
ncbi:MAG: hypothetical protein B7Z31_10575 [Rhodobacterales bacterium 12-65-15]|nr:MAG: hypothetical protein B7Z31_10575 [Rhodobacterales bacterium 12-65-15]